MTGGMWFVLGLALTVLAVFACCYAFSWALQASFHARCVVTEADRAREMYLEAAALLADGGQLRPRKPPTLYVVPAPPPVPEGRQRRCAVCLSDRDPIEVDFLSAPGGPEAAVYLCKDSDACAARCRGLEAVKSS